MTTDTAVLRAELESRKARYANMTQGFASDTQAALVSGKEAEVESMLDWLNELEEEGK